MSLFKSEISMQTSFSDRITRACVEKFLQLPKNGKPTHSEWTVLSCLVQYNVNMEDVEVVSLGTGSKCIGASKMSAKGDILNDSHAEVIARRGFLLYLYSNIEYCLSGQPSIFHRNYGKLQLKDSIRFAFFSSQLPCGDAAIHTKIDSDLVGNVVNTGNACKRNKQDDYPSKTSKLLEADDIHRTGAKCVKDAIQDPRESGHMFHTVGQVRTKPGRGDPTLSVSCSDKLAKWIHLGIQGALIDMFIDQPVYISKFIFGAAVPFCEKSLKRAFLERNYFECTSTPDIEQSSINFPHIKSECTTKPAASSILWVKTATPILEVAVLGRKLGVTKKSMNLPSSQLSICKYSLYQTFLSVLKLDQSLQQMIFESEEYPVQYTKMKEKSIRYRKRWSELKEKFFKTWTKKPDIWHFTVE